MSFPSNSADANPHDDKLPVSSLAPDMNRCNIPVLSETISPENTTFLLQKKAVDNEAELHDESMGEQIENLAKEIRSCVCANSTVDCIHSLTQFNHRIFGIVNAAISSEEKMSGNEGNDSILQQLSELLMLQDQLKTLLELSSKEINIRSQIT